MIKADQTLQTQRIRLLRQLKNVWQSLEHFGVSGHNFRPVTPIHLPIFSALVPRLSQRSTNVPPLIFPTPAS